MNIFKWMKPKKQKRGPARRPMYDIVEETHGMVDAIQQMLRDLAEQKPSDNKPEQQQEVWQKFQAYSELIAAMDAARQQANGQASEFEAFESYGAYDGEGASDGAEPID